jgi:hypothetical protein
MNMGTEACALDCHIAERDPDGGAQDTNAAFVEPITVSEKIFEGPLSWDAEAPTSAGNWTDTVTGVSAEGTGPHIFTRRSLTAEKSSYVTVAEEAMTIHWRISYAAIGVLLVKAELTALKRRVLLTVNVDWKDGTVEAEGFLGRAVVRAWRAPREGFLERLGMRIGREIMFLV